MRFILLVMLGVMGAAGCQHGSPKSDALAAKAPTPEPAEEHARKIAVTPATSLSGNVVYVNPVSRYIVLDFYSSVLPKEDQRFSVYRSDLKVGEVRISREARNHLIAADIMAGEAAVGDVARPD